MTPTTLIVVSGLPASGKTTLAHLLAAELRLPLVGRDDIKERLFESLGWSDREWSKRLGIASWDLLY
jgi:predicted kinase